MTKSGFNNYNRSGRHRSYETTGRMMMKTRLMLLGMLESQRRTRTTLRQTQMSIWTRRYGKLRGSSPRYWRATSILHDQVRNSKDTTPMPTLLSSRTGSAIFPPPAVFQPTMHILKRPASSSPSPGNQMASSSSGDTIQDREARYAAARERIFGSENPEKSKHLQSNWRAWFRNPQCDAWRNLVVVFRETTCLPWWKSYVGIPNRGCSLCCD